jgi:chemotaxis protein histidine kinase CheA
VRAGASPAYLPTEAVVKMKRTDQDWRDLLAKLAVANGVSVNYNGPGTTFSGSELTDTHGNVIAKAMVPGLLEFFFDAKDAIATLLDRVQRTTCERDEARRMAREGLEALEKVKAELAATRVARDRAVHAMYKAQAECGDAERNRAHAVEQYEACRVSREATEKLVYEARAERDALKNDLTLAERALEKSRKETAIASTQRDEWQKASRSEAARAGTLAGELSLLKSRFVGGKLPGVGEAAYVIADGTEAQRDHEWLEKFVDERIEKHAIRIAPITVSHHDSTSPAFKVGQVWRRKQPAKSGEYPEYATITKIDSLGRLYYETAQHRYVGIGDATPEFFRERFEPESAK